MAKQNRYNYNGKPAGAIYGHSKELERLQGTPTAKQRKFLRCLEGHMRQLGLEPYDEAHKAPQTRVEFSDAIERLSKICRENGVEIRSQSTPFEHVVTVKPETHFANDSVTELLKPKI